MYALIRTSAGRVLCTTQKGYLALAPIHTRVDDYVAIFHGGRMPLVVREAGQDFKVIRESYMHGLLNGEALDMGDYKVQPITLV